MKSEVKFLAFISVYLGLDQVSEYERTIQTSTKKASQCFLQFLEEMKIKYKVVILNRRRTTSERDDIEEV